MCREPRANRRVGRMRWLQRAHCTTLSLKSCATRTSAEKQLTKVLPKLAKAASSSELRSVFEKHLEETRGHVTRLEQVFESIDERAKSKHCEGIAGIVEEGKSIMGEDFEGTTMDACLVAAGQRAEHYEMAAYGTLVAWARVMGHVEAADLLQQTLDEEKAADRNSPRWRKTGSIRTRPRRLIKARTSTTRGLNQCASDGRPRDQRGGDSHAARAFAKSLGSGRAVKCVRFYRGSGSNRFVRRVERGRQQGTGRSTERGGRSAAGDPSGARQGHSEDLWDKASCVAVIRRREKSRLRRRRRVRQGRAELRQGAGWSAPSFMLLEKGSVGFQIGGQSVDLVLLIMNDRGIDRMLENKVALGGEMSVAGGPVGRDARAMTDAQLKAQILWSSRTQGLFAGIDLTGGVLKPDRDDNEDLYGRKSRSRDPDREDRCAAASGRRVHGRPSARAGRSQLRTGPCY